MAKPAQHSTESQLANEPRAAGAPSSPSTDPEAASSTQDAGEPKKMDSALKPLLWLLIPFIFAIVYGFLGP